MLNKTKDFQVSGGLMRMPEMTIGCFKLSFQGKVKYRIGKHFSKRFSELTEFVGDVDTEAINDGAGSDNDQHLAEQNTVSRPSDMAYRSSMAGVSVSSRIRIEHQLKKRKLKTVENSSIDIEPEQTLNEQVDEHSEDGIPITMDSILFQFDKCYRLYRRKGALQSHNDICTGKHQSQKIVDMTCAIALSILGTADAPIYTT